MTNNDIITPEADFPMVFSQICYDWGYDPKNILMDDHGNFVVNKTYITPIEMTYKMQKWTLKPGVFEKLEKLLEMLNGV